MSRLAIVDTELALYSHNQRDSTEARSRSLCRYKERRTGRLGPSRSPHFPAQEQAVWYSPYRSIWRSCRVRARPTPGPGPVWMRRWRCPDCRAVHTTRPHTHWRRFMAPWWLTLVSLLQKHPDERWLSLLARQRQHYRNRGYLNRQQADGGPCGIWALQEAGPIVATHSLGDRHGTVAQDPPHARFAGTAGPPGRSSRK